MNRPLSLLADFFLAPTQTRSPCAAEGAEALPSAVRVAEDEVAAWRGAASAVVGLVAPPAQTRGVAAALALGAAGRRVGVVAAWRCPRPSGAPACSAARRLVASLEARGLRATASGRLVWIALEADERAAVASLGPIEAAIGAVPLVLAVGGPRGRWIDEALGRCGTVHVGADTPELLDLTMARMVEQGMAARALGAPASALTRRLASSGIVLPGTAGRLRNGASEARA